MKLRPPAVVFLFLLGAAAALAGDHGHVVTGTLGYPPEAHQVPFVWSSPVWFPVIVGIATVALAEIRLLLPAVRTTVTVRHGIAGTAAVLGIYTLSGLIHAAPTGPATVLISALGAITWCALGDRYSVLTGVIAALVGPVAEALISAGGLFSYTSGSDDLFGVALWLPGLYFAFGVVAALLGEIAVAKQTQPRDSVGDEPAPVLDRAVAAGQCAEGGDG